MPVIWNNEIQVELYKHWPRSIRMTRPKHNTSIDGCQPSQRFSLKINNKCFNQDELTPVVSSDDVSADYKITVFSLKLTLHFQFKLENNEVIMTLPEVKEESKFRLEKLYIPDHRLITGTVKNKDKYFRVIGRRANWSRHWCPGAGFFNQWEDCGNVGDGIPELGPQYTDHACVWNKYVCAAITCSIHIEPLVTILESEGQALPGRAGQFSIWAGQYAYRLRGKLAEPFEIRIALLDDYNGTGKVGWCDAAAWEGDKKLKFEQKYNEVIVYKLYLDSINRNFPLLTFADCLSIIEQIHNITSGLKQIVYLVGWQYRGHDTGFPNHTEINERVGGIEELKKLINDAEKFNCIVSLHVNFDDSYEEYPEHDKELLSRGPDGKPYVWFFNKGINQLNVFSISHTLQVEKGFAKSRMERMLDIIPIKESIHFDAHRPYNEVWLADGTHIDAECEVQNGMIPIKKMFLEKGIDITNEGCGDDGLYSWGWHMPDWRLAYITVMCHGRVQGVNRKGLEGEALGCSIVRDEFMPEPYECIVRNFYLYWMYAQILFRKKMVDYRIGEWNETIEAKYEHDTRVKSGYSQDELEADYEGIPMARGTDRFLPWRDNVIYAYSLDGELKEWTLPASWAGAKIRAKIIRQGGESPGPELTIDGRIIKFQAPPGLPVKLMR